MRDEHFFYSQSQKSNSTRKNLVKSVTFKGTLNTHKELASNVKETITIDEKTINGDIQTNVNKNNCNEETVTNIDNNNTILQVNVDNHEITSKDTLEHQNNDKDNDQEKIKNNDQEKIFSSQKSQKLI